VSAANPGICQPYQPTPTSLEACQGHRLLPSEDSLNLQIRDSLVSGTDLGALGRSLPCVSKASFCCWAKAVREDLYAEENALHAAAIAAKGGAEVLRERLPKPMTTDHLSPSQGSTPMGLFDECVGHARKRSAPAKGAMAPFTARCCC